jgi:hypothetical protein
MKGGLFGRVCRNFEPDINGEVDKSADEWN